MPPDWSDIREKIEEFVEQHAIQVEALTKRQMAEAIRQALMCGDFVRYIRVTDYAQQIVYLPYAREQELESRIKTLESILEKHGIQWKDEAG